MHDTPDGDSDWELIADLCRNEDGEAEEMTLDDIGDAVLIQHAPVLLDVVEAMVQYIDIVLIVLNNPSYSPQAALLRIRSQLDAVARRATGQDSE